MATAGGVSCLCGRIAYIGTSSGTAVLRLKTGEEICASFASDPGLAKVEEGKRRMVIFRGATIWAVYGRPRIKLLRTLEREGVITEEILEMYRPMYLKQFG